jgi:hypothetical protein
MFVVSNLNKLYLYDREIRVKQSYLFKKIVLDEKILNITRHQIILKTNNKSEKKLLPLRRYELNLK